jgi:hypothetical protein
LRLSGNTAISIEEKADQEGNMIKRLLSFGIALSLICCLGGMSVFGKTRTDSTEVLEPTSPPVKSEAKANQKLRADVLKLTADAKAGKIVPRSPSPFQPRQRNNLSKGAKIAIVAGIGALIFGIYAWHVLNSDDD